ncbi:unnamed protein product [Toxocara canis]|uniref:AcidPPc domain-containing protein n=1 Tax=Toxocara canis TaxID=6265 RepID=A0A183UTE7_TOXCA|nr:unnamed protein product [Toxocara canis]
MLGKYSLSSRFGRDWLTARDDERLLLVRSAIVMGIDICVSLLGSADIKNNPAKFDCVLRASLEWLSTSPNGPSASYLVYKTITTFLIFPVERGFYCRDIQDLSSPCFLLAVIVNQLCKCAIGRLRPNFLSVCNPRWERIDCSTGDMWVADAFCKGSSKAVKKARTRYCPSGHATVSVLAMCFLIAYFYRILPRSSLSGLLSWIRYCVLVLFYLCVSTAFRNGYCLVTRITDLWHFPSDVVWGALIGFSAAYIFFMRRVNVDYKKFHVVKVHSS